MLLRTEIILLPLTLRMSAVLILFHSHESHVQQNGNLSGIAKRANRMKAWGAKIKVERHRK
jgi:hypothetical protein